MNYRGMICALAVLIGAGCSSTYQVREAQTSGFLNDYSQLRKGSGREPRLIYYNPEADLLRYDKILIDPVVAYRNEQGGRPGDLTQDDTRALLNYFHAALREQLGRDYEVVEQPEPGTLRLRVAITDARASKVVMDTLSSVVPVGLAVSALERIALGKTLTAGSVRVEAEAVDGQTGEVLGAMVDERSGSKVTGRFDKWSKWQDARDALDYWANQLRENLEKLRARKKNMRSAAEEPMAP